MDKGGARAISIALSLYFWNRGDKPVPLWHIFGLSDKFFNYIDQGLWPQEAVEQIGKGNEVEEGRIARVRAEIQGQAQEG